MSKLSFLIAPALSLTVICSATAQAVTPELDVPFVPTPRQVVHEMLRMADVKPEDILYDLGSGDGRIVIAAAKDFGVRKAVGVDLNPERIQEANTNAELADVADRVEFKEADLFKFDFSDATVVTMYLLTNVNLKLRPRILSELKPGTRIVSHQFDMGEWKPDESKSLEGRDIYFWVVPAKAEGTWQWSTGSDQYELELHQEFQQLAGRLRAADQDVAIENAKLVGDQLSFRATIDGRPLQFEGKVTGGAITGNVINGKDKSSVTARRSL